MCSWVLVLDDPILMLFFIVKQITRKALEFNKPAYVCYDNFGFCGVSSILLENDVLIGIIILIKDICCNKFAQIRIQNELRENSCFKQRSQAGRHSQSIIVQYCDGKNCTFCETSTMIPNGK